MDCQYIYIFKGDDTNWNNEQFLTVNISSDTADLSTMTAKFILGSYTQEFPLTSGSFQIDLSAAITGQYAFGPIYGTIQILDSESRIKTACNTIPFYITDKVISEQHQTLDVDMPEESPIHIDLSVGDDLNYNDLLNKPSINQVTLQGNKTGGDLGLLQPSDLLPVTEDITALQTSVASKQDALSQAQLDAANSGIDTTKVWQIATNANDITTIEGKIPAQASASNQLADKDFVNSTVATNTANFIGTFTSVEDLEAYSGALTNNDYAFVETTDQAGNTLYKRYKYNANTQQWVFEYELNNSSFTAEQWAALNSGATTTNIGQIATNTSAISSLGSSKQDVISDLATIRSGASAGATALQPATAQATYVPLSQKGVAAGVATLDNTGQITDGQINYATATRVGGIKQTFDPATGTWTVITEDL